MMIPRRCLCFLRDGCVSYGDLDVFCCLGFVEYAVYSFCRVRDQVVGMEVCDEVGEFLLCDVLECLHGGCDDEGGIVGVSVDSGLFDCVDDVVDVEEEERGGECAALWDPVGDCLGV